MATARHKRAAAVQRSKRARTVGVPLLVLAVGTTALVATRSEHESGPTGATTSVAMGDQTALQRRDVAGSRSLRRPAPPASIAGRAPAPTPRPKPTVTATPRPSPIAEPKPTATASAEPKPVAVDHRYATALLRLRTTPTQPSGSRGLLGAGDRVAITGRDSGAYTQVLVDGRVAWVTADYLASTRPEPAAASPSSAASSAAPSRSGGVSAAPCPSGSSVEAGLTAHAVAVHRAVCAAFPSVRAYGGVGGGGEHASGHAVDIMVSGSTGDSIAAWVRSHAAQLGVSEVIWSQRIWTVQRGSEGWRPMEDRGSPTANHYDHVHVTVY